MSTASLSILRRYAYDPLDRLASAGLVEFTQRFYQEDQLITELGPRTQRTILRHQAQPLAQRRREAELSETTLLMTDQAHSLLRAHSVADSQQFAYTAYGHHPAAGGSSQILGFNGECPDDITGHYLLGQGKRAFNPVLMRFNSPDELSPFGEGGINSYAYCGADPINFVDPTGRIKLQILSRGLNRPSVIVKNPQHAIKKTISSIAGRANKAEQNPLLNSLLNTRISSTSMANPKPSALRQVPVPKLRTTKLRWPKTLTPDAKTIAYRERLKSAKLYDELVKNPGFRPTASESLVQRLNSVQHAYERAINSPLTPTRKQYYPQATYRKVELEIKHDVIRRLGSNAPR